jgi:hypothetical protein
LQPKGTEINFLLSLASKSECEKSTIDTSPLGDLHWESSLDLIYSGIFFFLNLKFLLTNGDITKTFERKQKLYGFMFQVQAKRKKKKIFS